MNFINNTVANNSVASPNNNSSAAAIYYCDWVPGQGRNSSTLYAFNNIIYGNKDNGSIDEHQIEAHCGGPVIRADYNNIHNLSKIGEAGNNASAGLNNYDYSLDIDPAFKDGNNNDFSLDNKSLMIGAGTANWSDWGIVAPTKDKIGNSDQISWFKPRSWRIRK